MGVKDSQGRLFLGHVAQHCQEGHVLEHIGMVAGMKSVAVTEHGLDGNRHPLAQGANLL
jgi:hypothetical protein